MRRQISTVEAAALDVEAALGAAEPLIVRGEADSWPARTRWTWEFLQSRYGESWVPARHGDDVDLFMRRMRALVEEIRAGERVYAVDWDFTADHPELEQDVGRSALGRADVLACLPPEVRPRFFWLYLGAKGTGSALHQDVLQTHAWLALLSGQKRWVQYPPSAFRREEGKRFDAFAEGAAALDEAAGRTRFEADVSAGDVMFVPSLWWHQVENLSPTISLTANFADRALLPRVLAEASRGRYQALVPHLEALMCV